MAAGRLSSALLLCLLVTIASPSEARVTLDGYKERLIQWPDDASNVTLNIDYRVERAGSTYAKMLVTPWNPVNNGSGHLDRHPDAAWHVTMQLLSNSTAQTEAVDRNDSTPTKAIVADPDIAYTLRVTIHAPSEDTCQLREYKVPFAIAFREGDFRGDTTSGGRLEQSRGFTAILQMPDAPCLLSGPNREAPMPPVPPVPTPPPAPTPTAPAAPPSTSSPSASSGAQFAGVDATTVALGVAIFLAVLVVLALLIACVALIVAITTLLQVRASEPAWTLVREIPAKEPDDDEPPQVVLGIRDRHQTEEESRQPRARND